MPPSYCKNCLLPGNAPGAQLDRHGLCAACRLDSKEDPSAKEVQRLAFAADLEKALQECRGKAQYDCLVCFSGGKDSVYILYKLVREYKMKVLAFTEYSDLPPVAEENIQRTIKVLDVDHVVYAPSPSFYKKLVRYLLQNQNARGAVATVGPVIALLHEGYALRLAIEKRIPLILSGYAPAQRLQQSMYYELLPAIIREKDWTPPSLIQSGLFTPSELSLFWNPLTLPRETPFPRFLAPLHAWDYNQQAIMQKIISLGLVANRKHASPIYSNFTLNWLLMYSDLKNLGYNPYNPEFSQLIRQGKASRQYWKIMIPLVNFMIRNKILLGANVAKALHELNLKSEDLIVRK